MGALKENSGSNVLGMSELAPLTRVVRRSRGNRQWSGRARSVSLRPGRWSPFALVQQGFLPPAPNVHVSSGADYYQARESALTNTAPTEGPLHEVSEGTMDMNAASREVGTY